MTEWDEKAARNEEIIEMILQWKKRETQPKRFIVKSK